MTRLIRVVPLLTLAATVTLFGADAFAQRIDAFAQRIDAQETDPVLHIENVGGAPGEFERGPLDREPVDRGRVNGVPDQRHDWSYDRPSSHEEQVAAAIQLRAQIRSQQRALRLAAQKWYGVSNARPTVTLTSAWSLYRPARSQRQFQRFALYRVPSLPAAPIAPPTITR